MIYEVNLSTKQLLDSVYEYLLRKSYDPLIMPANKFGIDVSALSEVVFIVPETTVWKKKTRLVVLDKHTMQIMEEFISQTRSFTILPLSILFTDKNIKDQKLFAIDFRRGTDEANKRTTDNN